MNPHPFKTKRPRPQTGGEEPVPSSSLTPRLDLSHNSLPSDIRHQLDRVAQFYGYSSGYQVHLALQQGHSRKKRRLDRSIPMAQQRGSSSAQGSLDKFPYDHHHHQGQSGPESSWSESRLSSLPSPSSPLHKRMADLSLLLCPFCGGFGSKQPDGYQQLPEAPPVVYGPRRAYDVEKPPSMQIPTSESYDDSANLPLGQESIFPSCDQANLTSPPLTGFPLLPEQPSLATPMIYGDNSSHQHGLSVPEYYSLKHDPELSSPSVVSGYALPQDAPVPYAPDLLSFSTQVLPTSQDVSHYNMVPEGQLDAGVPQDVWGDCSLLDHPDSFGILLPNQRGGKRGPFKDPTLREQTAQTRRIGSCIRCRMQRIRCETNPDEIGGPCLTCKKVANSRAGRFPCLRYKITDIRLYKPGQVPGYEWTRRWNNNISDPIQNWASNDTKVIRISEGLTDKFVEFQVRRFIPQDGDKLERTWDFNGTKKSVSIPPYALVNLEAGRDAYSAHIRDSMRDTFKIMLGPTNGLLFMTYLMALQVTSHASTPKECKDLLSRTLKLWMSIRLSTRSGFIVGEETLGMHCDILDETNPNHGMIPVPPVLGAQLDVILIHHIQTKLRRELLDKLQKMIQKNKQTTWLISYLVIFILLHNTALITAHDASYARKHGMKRRFAREDKVKEYHLGANILLAHFHYCNKGIYPFSEECKDQDLRNLANLDEGKIQFVHRTRAYARRHKQAWEELQDQAAYEDDYFFVSQLFEENWQPRVMT